MKKIIVIGVVLVLIAAGVVWATRGSSDKDGGGTRVKAERGTIVDKALATGQIVPREEVQVKSQISGIVKTCYVDVGDAVAAGDKLLEIAPNPTPLELTESERSLQLADIALDRTKIEHDRKLSLLEGGLISEDEYDAARKEYDRFAVERDLARERLALIKDGRIQGSRPVDSVIRAPASGTVLERLVDPGEPVVPLTSFQEGTVLLTIADMGDLIFEGTVDEIDVGKLAIGLSVRIDVGALPNAEIGGRVARIAPKAKEEEGSTLFDVEVSIDETGGAFLRAGYSANADVIIQEKEGVVLSPERVVAFEGEKAYVELPPEREGVEPERREIQVGLSDGLNVEVLSGLAEGDEVWQRPPKKIE
ncbi:MAG: efflux RND transporter periplasmic adaptor subunit [Candidatus Latescibacterota bacterium]|nr:MAG: efflux RND transporter periplasmic adaptor subunit [Candidatus Latescibacterota bacterium]